MAVFCLFLLAYAASESWTLPDQSVVIGESGFPVVLRFSHITLTNIQIDSDQSSVYYTGPNTIETQIFTTQGQLNFTWSHDDPLGADGGRASVTYKDMKLHAFITTHQQAGRETIETTKLLVQAGACQIVLEDSPYAESGTWLFRFLLGCSPDSSEVSVPPELTREIDSDINRELMNENLSVREAVVYLQLFLSLA